MRGMYFATLLGFFAARSALAGETQSTIYWTDWATGMVTRAAMDGSGATDILGPLSNPLGIAVDPGAGHLYVADAGGENGNGTDPGIRLYTLDGQGGDMIVAGGRPTDIALELDAGLMYWTDYEGDNNVWVANLDGSNPLVLISGKMSNPYGIALDKPHGKIYLVEAGGAFDPSIIRVNLDGSGFEVLLTGNLLSDIALDVTGGKMYWTAGGGSANVWRANLDGSEPESLISDAFSNPYGITLDLTCGYMYLTDWGGEGGQGTKPSVTRANLDGSGLTFIAQHVNRPTDLVILPLEPGCPANCNDDCVLDIFDFLCFTNKFNAEDTGADCDGDGGHTLFDFLCFVNAFNAGC